MQVLFLFFIIDLLFRIGLVITQWRVAANLTELHSFLVHQS